MQLRRTIGVSAWPASSSFSRWPFPALRTATFAGGPAVSSRLSRAARGRWPPRPERHLAGIRDGELRPPGSRGAAGSASGAHGRVWRRPAGQSIVEGGEIPYKPDALAKKKANFENRLRVDVSNDKTWHALGDPEMKCYMPGVPRATYMPFPFQIVQGTSPYILMAYEFASATRIIRMDWKQAAPTDSWMGWSRGRWEGDTLVVDVTGQREETWFDRAGDFHSDALHVVERYTPVSPYHLMYEATIEDPKVFTRPWKISFPLYRRMEKNVQLLEFKCVPFTEELLFGKFRKQAAR